MKLFVTPVSCFIGAGKPVSPTPLSDSRREPRSSTDVRLSTTGSSKNTRKKNQRKRPASISSSSHWKPSLTPISEVVVGGGFSSPVEKKKADVRRRVMNSIATDELVLAKLRLKFRKSDRRSLKYPDDWKEVDPVAVPVFAPAPLMYF